MVVIQRDGYFTGNKASGYKVKGNLPPELLQALKDLLESLESDDNPTVSDITDYDNYVQHQ